MGDTTKLVGILLLLSVCAAVIVLATPALEVQQIEAETKQTEAEVELTEAQTSQESQQALSEVVKELLAELRAERESQRETLRLLLELVAEREKPSYTWLWVVAGIGVIGVIGVVMAVLFLRRGKHIVVMMLPQDAQSLWLPVGPTDIVPWQESGAIQMAQVSQEGQEIAIE